MAKLFEETAGKTRDLPIQPILRRLLIDAADAVGIDIVHVTSGGQAKKGTPGKRTGSTRHDEGFAADLHLEQGGEVLTFTDAHGNPTVEAFVTAAAAHGALGIGAGERYMGNATLHVGYGTSRSDKTKLVWGAEGKAAKAPAWLRAAARKGWDAPIRADDNVFTVTARSGVRLRAGPGIEFAILTTIPAGREVSVADFDGQDRQWARVDLEGDGLVDGHVFAAFLVPAGLAPAKLTEAASLSADTESVQEPEEA